MKIVPKIDANTIQSAVSRFATAVDTAALTWFIKAGDSIVETARQKGEYLNHSFDLRSSLGYMIIKGGVVLAKNFRTEGSGTNGEREARDMALTEGIRSGYPGFLLIVVAGMSYAIYVESKGKDVLTGSVDSGLTILKQGFLA